MEQPSPSPDALGRVRRLSRAGAVAAAAAVLVGQLTLPANVYPGTLSALVVAMGALGRSRRLVWTLAVVLAAASLLAPLVGPSPVEPNPGPWLIWLNRAVTATGTVVAGAIASLWIGAQEALGAERLRLAAQNETLEAVNAELAARESEIASQNEELQLQHEELERQG